MLLKTGRGRRAKSANRFEGPFRVVSRERDIYVLGSIDKIEKRVRIHTADLKPFVNRAHSNSSPSQSIENASSANQDTSINETMMPTWLCDKSLHCYVKIIVIR